MTEAVDDTLPRFGLGDSDEEQEEDEGSVDEDSGFVLQKHVDRPLLLDVRTTHDLYTQAKRSATP